MQPHIINRIFLTDCSVFVCIHYMYILIQQPLMFLFRL